MENQFWQVLKKEGIIKNEPSMRIESANKTEHGRLILTTKRLIFARINDTAKTFTRNFTPQKLELVIEIDLDTINTVARETYFVDENILSLTYMQLEIVKFSVIHYEEWEKEIQAARMNPDIPGDPNKTQEAA